MKKMLRDVTSITLVLFLGAGQAVASGLSLSNVIIELGGEQPLRSDIQARNDGDETLYVVTEPALIEAPGLAVEERRNEPDPGQLGLLVTPRRFVLPPGGSRVIRFAALSPAETQDRIYRVSVRPVPDEDNRVASGVKILLGFDALVIVRPASARFEIQSRREGSDLILTNAGNTNAILFDGQICPKGDGECQDLKGKRLYAGASHRIALNRPDDVVTFTAQAAADSRSLRFD